MSEVTYNHKRNSTVSTVSMFMVLALGLVYLLFVFTNDPALQKAETVKDCFINNKIEENNNYYVNTDNCGTMIINSENYSNIQLNKSYNLTIVNNDNEDTIIKRKITKINN